MAAKVFLLNESGLKPEKVKRSAAEYLCRVLMATKISQYVYQRLKISPAANINLPRQAAFKPSLPDSGEPCQSPRMGKLRWEPPKHKRDLKPHPWAHIHPPNRVGLGSW